MFEEFFLYLCVGMVNTISGYLSILTFQNILNFSPQLSNLFGYMIGLIISFFLNKEFVFKSKKGNKLSYGIRFIYSFIISYFLNFISLLILIKSNVKLYIAQAISMIIYSICFYIICKYYVFKKNKA